MHAAAGKAGFPRAARLLRPDDFARVFAARQTAAQGPIVLHGSPAPTQGQPARLGVSVSRRIGNAVVRNGWKRRLREAFRQVRTSLPSGNDFVIVVRSGLPPVGAVGQERMEETILTLARRVAGRPGYAAVRGGAPVARRRRR